MSDHQLN